MNHDKEPAIPLSDGVRTVIDEFFCRYPHLKEVGEGLVEGYQAIANVFEQGGILYICGNGGSFADAVHIKGELAKRFEKPRPITDEKVIESLGKSELGEKLLGKLERGLPVVVLGESHGLRSAYENDQEPLFSYAQELNSFVERVKSGVLLGISTGGNAGNVLAAMTLARAYGLTTISFTGPGGGAITQMADISICVPGGSTAEIQENQVPIYHCLCRMIEIHFFRTAKNIIGFHDR